MDAAAVHSCGRRTSHQHDCDATGSGSGRSRHCPSWRARLLDLAIAQVGGVAQTVSLRRLVITQSGSYCVVPQTNRLRYIINHEEHYEHAPAEISRFVTSFGAAFRSRRASGPE